MSNFRKFKSALSLSLSFFLLSLPLSDTIIIGLYICYGRVLDVLEGGSWLIWGDVGEYYYYYY